MNFLSVRKDHFAMDDFIPDINYRFGRELIRISDIIHVYEVKGSEDEFIICIEYESAKGQRFLYESFGSKPELNKRFDELTRLLNGGNEHEGI